MRRCSCVYYFFFAMKYTINAFLSFPSYFPYITVEMGVCKPSGNKKASTKAREKFSKFSRGSFCSTCVWFHVYLTFPVCSAGNSRRILRIGYLSVSITLEINAVFNSVWCIGNERNCNLCLFASSSIWKTR